MRNRALLSVSVVGIWLLTAFGVWPARAEEKKERADIYKMLGVSKDAAGSSMSAKPNIPDNEAGAGAGAKGVPNETPKAAVQAGTAKAKRPAQ